jgi:hypothetical protein
MLAAEHGAEPLSVATDSRLDNRAMGRVSERKQLGFPE